MVKIPFNPESVTADNSDVRRMLAMLESGFRFKGTAPRCPVCGCENMYLRVVCQREYCSAVWKTVRKLFRNRTKPDVETRPEAFFGPLRGGRRPRSGRSGTGPSAVTGWVPRSPHHIAARTGSALTLSPATARREDATGHKERTHDGRAIAPLRMWGRTTAAVQHSPADAAPVAEQRGVFRAVPRLRQTDARI